MRADKLRPFFLAYTFAASMISLFTVNVSLLVVIRAIVSPKIRITPFRMKSSSLFANPNPFILKLPRVQIRLPKRTEQGSNVYKCL